MATTTSTYFKDMRDVTKDVYLIGAKIFLSVCMLVYLAYTFDKCKEATKITDEQEKKNLMSQLPTLLCEHPIVHGLLIAYAVIMMILYISLLLTQREVLELQKKENDKKATSPSTETKKLYTLYNNSFNKTEKLAKGLYVVLAYVVVAHFGETAKSCIKWCCSCSM